MLRRPPRSTRTDTLFPYTTLFRSLSDGKPLYRGAPRRRPARQIPEPASGGPVCMNDDRTLHAHLIGRQGSRADLNTPALILDVDALDRNIAALAALTASKGDRKSVV